MVVYHHRRIQLKTEGGEASNWSHEKTEVMQKIYCSHRDVNIIDGIFIAQVMRECISIKDEEMGDIIKTT